MPLHRPSGIGRQQGHASGGGTAPAGANVGADGRGLGYRPSWDEVAHTDSQKGTLTENNKAGRGFAPPGGMPAFTGSGGIQPPGVVSNQTPVGGTPGAPAGEGASGGSTQIFTDLDPNSNQQQLHASRDPGQAGREWILDFIQKGGNPERLRGLLENTELAYNTAANKARNLTYGSGAGEGGVAKMGRGNIEMSKGAAKARDMRQDAQFQDQQISSLIDMWLKHYNNAYAIAQGGAQIPDQGSGITDFMTALAPYLISRGG